MRVKYKVVPQKLISCGLNFVFKSITLLILSYIELYSYMNFLSNIISKVICVQDKLFVVFVCGSKVLHRLGTKETLPTSPIKWALGFWFYASPKQLAFFVL